MTGKKPQSEDPEVWKLTHLQDTKASFDPDKAWERFRIRRDFRERNRTNWYWMRIAAAVVLLMVLTVILVNNPVNKENTSIIALQEIRKLELPDGSMVWLNEGSRLTYRTEDFQRSRKVTLEGEAFFEVRKITNQNFIVFAGDTRTEVLGTSFNVKTDLKGDVSVKVATGRVAFSKRSNPKDPLILTPGEEGITGKESSQPIMKKAIEDLNFRSWQNQKLEFRNEPLMKIVNKLQDHYDTPILVSEALSNCRFTVKFRDQPLKEVLKVLVVTGDLKLSERGNGYLIEGEKCEN